MGNCCGKKQPVVAPVKQPPPPLKAPPPPRRDPAALGRFSQLAFGITDPSKLIEGYEKEPLGTLEEALQPFEGRIDNLYEQIAEAKRRCHYPGNDGLSRDESASIYLYSMRNDPNSVYSHLQRAWASNDRNQMRPWFKYLRLFFSGVNRCPDVHGEVWQGVQYNENVQQQLHVGTSPIYTYMGSGSPTIDVVKEHLNDKHGKRMILIGYKDVNAKDISDYTADGIEEWLLHPGIKLSRSQQMIDTGDGTVIFHLSGKSKPASPEIFTPKSITPALTSRRDTPLMKHFVCPTRTCGNMCLGNHDPGHCSGFDSFHHSCSHHCGPKNTCLHCGKQLADLRKCKKCGEYYCIECCLKESEVLRKIYWKH